MEFETVVRRRRMARSFEDRPVPPEVVTRILAHARKAPSAGFSQGWAFVVLEGAEQTAQFWELTSEPEWRANPNWPGLLRAPVIILPLAHEQAYRERYSQPDKGSIPPDQQVWDVPYWLVDTAFSTMLMLLSVVDGGLGALFLHINHGRQQLLSALGVPPGYEPIGAIAVGYPDGNDRPSPSLARGHRSADDVVHRGRW
jgi:nitroreductase